MNTHLKVFMATACGFFVMLFAGSAFSAPMNLVPNGDFELGNTQFGSDYSFSPASNTAESQYTVRTNPFPWNGFFISTGDHTSGSGNLFVGNGAPRDQRVWFSSGISVTPNTDYFFEAWVINVCCNPSFGQGNNPVNPAILSFYANGVLIGTRSTNLLGVWEGLSTTWNSGAFTSVDLELRNSNLLAQGNDFGTDDIFLGTQSTVTPVPEPSSVVLLMSGIVGLAAMRRVNRNRSCTS